MAIHTALSCSRQHVQDAVDVCLFGDEAVIPANVGSPTSWTEAVSISLAITVRGQTTVDAATGIYDDQTIIVDDVTTDWNPCFYVSAPSGTARLTGITLKPGARTTKLNGGGVSVGLHARLDHCHLWGLYRTNGVLVGGATSSSVVDHNVFSYDGTNPFTQSLLVRMGDWGGDTNGIGDKSFADYPWFGTEKFIFIENNYFKNESGTPLMGDLDCDFGSRIVFRHNQCFDVQVHNHGTETRYRGARCGEIYENDFHFSTLDALGLVRTGAYLYHNNRFYGTSGSGWLNLNYVRSFFTFGRVDGFAGASGDNPWDVNADSDGVTPVAPGQPGHSFVGTRTCGGGSTQGVIVDNGAPGWATNQWAGYTVKRVADGGISIVLSNTSNTLTVTIAKGGYTNELPFPVWTAGDQYEIRKVLIAIDQPGRGKGDEIYGAWNKMDTSTTSLTIGTGSKSLTIIGSTGFSIGELMTIISRSTGAWMRGAVTSASYPNVTCNVTEIVGSGTFTDWNVFALEDTVTLTQIWPNQALEPCYSWGNLYNGTDPVGFSVVNPPYVIAGRDYYNGSSSAAVIAKYTAALNGVDYLGPYTYPHPLAGDEITPPAAPTGLALQPFGP